MASIIPDEKKIKTFRTAQAFERWLDPSNFDESGAQRRTLADFREEG